MKLHIALLIVFTVGYFGIPFVYAQEITPTENVAWIALIVASVSSAGVIGGFVLNWKKLRDENTNNMITLLTNLAHDMSKEIEKEIKISTRLECIIYMITYLDNLNRIAILFEKKRVPYDMKEYFSIYFAYGLTIEQFYKEFSPPSEQQLGRGRWKRIHQWCKQESISALTENTLPKTMLDLKNKKAE